MFVHSRIVLSYFFAAVAACSCCDAFQLFTGQPGTLRVGPGMLAKCPMQRGRRLFTCASGLRMMSASNEEGDMQPQVKSSSLKVSFPSPDEGAEMGIREWPGFLKKDSNFEEEVQVGTVRYILEGQGTCTPEGESAIEMAPGTLLECTSATNLAWKVASPMVILTPKFEQPGILAAGALLLFGGLGWLVANAKDTKAVKKANQDQ